MTKMTDREGSEGGSLIRLTNKERYMQKLVIPAVLIFSSFAMTSAYAAEAMFGGGIRIDGSGVQPFAGGSTGSRGGSGAGIGAGGGLGIGGGHGLAAGAGAGSSVSYLGSSASAGLGAGAGLGGSGGGLAAAGGLAGGLRLR